MKTLISWYRGWKNKRIQKRIERNKVDHEELMRDLEMIVDIINAIFKRIKDEHK